ncbi:hypothetical protein TNCV_2092001 [Trichonephila clavipes]|nr:hypothetical protein TNCV_2092001 [Trichonephila clavipes]
MERKGVGKIGVKYLFSHLSQIYCCQGSSVHFTWRRISRTVELVVAAQRSFHHHFDNPPRSHVRPDWKYVSKPMDAFQATEKVSNKRKGPPKTVRTTKNVGGVRVSIRTMRNGLITFSTKNSSWVLWGRKRKILSNQIQKRSVSTQIKNIF